MYINKQIYNFMKTDKPKKDFRKIIDEYVKKSLPFGYITSAPLDGYFLEKLPDHDSPLCVRMVSSGNEPKIYCFIYDEKNKESIFTSRILSDTPETYGTLATIAGAYLETIKLYMTINDL